MKTSTNFMTFLIFCFIFGISYSAKTQEIISSSGIYSESANNSISWINGGEIAESNRRADCLSTSSFNQTNISVVSEWEIQDINVEITAVSIQNIVKVNFPKSNYENFKLQLIDPNGTVLKNQNVLNPEIEILFGDLPSASYILKVIDKKKEIKSFKVIKN